MQEKIEIIKKGFEEDLSRSATLADVENLRIKYLSKNGSVTLLFDELRNADKEHKPLLGKSLNDLKNYCQSSYQALKERIESSVSSDYSSLDLTLPGRSVNFGKKHIIIKTLDEVKTIFRRMGFSIYDGPEIESDYNNFSALNFPDDHPARDMQDTFFINKNFLLRTHTSPVQIRVMKNQQPPVRAIMPGKVFRNEDINARSYCLFHQVEGLCVDTDITFAELKGTLFAFAKEFYGSDIKYRFRSSFFPFTEPSAEMDITCYLCNGKGCRICKHTGWLEILGCGMVDPNVFKSVGYDDEKYTGYAFGMGIERIALLKYGIDDIRLLFENDVRFLRQF